ncbi:hypothetical protein ACAG10_24270, partial [Escherichia coli]
KSAQIREILISESAWEEMTCLFAPSLTLILGDVLRCSIDNDSGIMKHRRLFEFLLSVIRLLVANSVMLPTY